MSVAEGAAHREGGPGPESPLGDPEPCLTQCPSSGWPQWGVLCPHRAASPGALTAWPLGFPWDRGCACEGVARSYKLWAPTQLSLLMGPGSLRLWHQSAMFPGTERRPRHAPLLPSSQQPTRWKRRLWFHLQGFPLAGVVPGKRARLPATWSARTPVRAVLQTPRLDRPSTNRAGC